MAAALKSDDLFLLRLSLLAFEERTRRRIAQGRNSGATDRILLKKLLDDIEDLAVRMTAGSDTDAAPLARLADERATCLCCGCTEFFPCELEGGPCGWHQAPGDDGYGVCTNPDCVAAHRGDEPVKFWLDRDLSAGVRQLLERLNNCTASHVTTHGPLTTERLLRLVLEDCVQAQVRPGSWQAVGLMRLLQSHGYVL